MPKPSAFLLKLQREYEAKLLALRLEYEAKFQIERHCARVFQMDVEAADTIDELLQCCDGLERDNDSLCATIEEQKAQITALTAQDTDEPCEACKIEVGNERLTIREDSTVYIECGDKVDITQKEIFDMVKERLAQYEDAEEQGRLIILPNKIGDHVFLAHRGRVEELEIGNITDNVFYTRNVENGFRDVDIYPNDFGRYVFQTREEAERALQEARSGQ